MKHAELTIIVQKDKKEGWFVGQIEEFPAAISQEKTIEELKLNLIDALKLLLDSQKEILTKEYSRKKMDTTLLVKPKNQESISFLKHLLLNLKDVESVEVMKPPTGRIAKSIDTGLKETKLIISGKKKAKTLRQLLDEN